jgi:hypothetical protein
MRARQPQAEQQRADDGQHREDSDQYMMGAGFHEVVLF